MGLGGFFVRLLAIARGLPRSAAITAAAQITTIAKHRPGHVRCGHPPSITLKDCCPAIETIAPITCKSLSEMAGGGAVTLLGDT